MEEEASIYTGKKQRLGTVDYVLFSLLFVFSAVIGFYHAYRDRKKRNTDDFHLGGRKMHPIPVAMSLSATFLSALTLLGTPAEIYTNGTMYIWIILAMLIATAGAAHLFIPVFYNLNKVSCFEYLQLRYGTVLRIIASLVFLLQTLVYMGFVLYAPSLAFQAVTGVSLWGTMIGVAAVCTLYTTLGGMKTVLWTDTLQFIVMIAGLLCVLILGSNANGGFLEAWDIADANGRIKLDDFSFDPKTRHSVWTVAIGGSFFWMYLYGINQAQVQRALSLRSITHSRIALWLNFPGLVIVITLTCLIGVVMYAFYSGCHPVKYGMVSRNDQLLPLFVLDIMGKYDGLTGIFLACIFSGSLSTISSGLNAMSAIVLEDFMKVISKKVVSGRKGMLLSKIVVLLTGGVQFGIAVALSEFKGLIVQFSYSLYSILAGPIFGIFVAGMFFPWTNQSGATTGFILSMGFMCWLGFGGIVEKPPSKAPKLPLYTNLCNWNVSGFQTPAPLSTTTFLSTVDTVTTTNTEEPIIYDFYRISYLWYTGLGMIVCVVLSLIVSFMTGCTKPSTVDSRLMCPFIERIFPCLPESIKKPLRFGVSYDKHIDYEEQETKTERKVSIKFDSKMEKEVYLGENSRQINEAYTGDNFTGHRNANNGDEFGNGNAINGISCNDSVSVRNSSGNANGTCIDVSSKAGEIGVVTHL